MLGWKIKFCGATRRRSTRVSASARSGRDDPRHARAATPTSRSVRKMDTQHDRKRRGAATVPRNGKRTRIATAARILHARGRGGGKGASRSAGGTTFPPAPSRPPMARSLAEGAGVASSRARRSGARRGPRPVGPPSVPRIALESACDLRAAPSRCRGTRAGGPRAIRAGAHRPGALTGWADRAPIAAVLPQTSRSSRLRRAWWTPRAVPVAWAPRLRLPVSPVRLGATRRCAPSSSRGFHRMSRSAS